MRELSFQEVESVVGGLVPPTNVYPGMDYRVAIRTFPGLRYVAGSFAAGYAAGTWLNNNTSIQEYIADGIDWFS